MKCLHVRGKLSKLAAFYKSSLKYCCCFEFHVKIYIFIYVKEYSAVLFTGQVLVCALGISHVNIRDVLIGEQYGSAAILLLISVVGTCCLWFYISRSATWMSFSSCCAETSQNTFK